MSELILVFCKLALRNKNESIDRLFNRFVQSLEKEEQQFANEQFMLFLKAGEAARDAIPEMQQKILQN